jgi:hypothetical protein
MIFLTRSSTGNVTTMNGASNASSKYSFCRKIGPTDRTDGTPRDI